MGADDGDDAVGGIGLGVDDPVWDATTFTKKRARPRAGQIALKFLTTAWAPLAIAEPDVTGAAPTSSLRTPREMGAIHCCHRCLTA